MGTYAQALHMFQKMVVEVVFESLGLNPNYLHEELEEGSQVMAVNCYPPCPEPDLVLGMPPHSDYGYLTILTQNHQGLEVMDHNKMWHPVPLVEGALIILLGDQMEVISNGHYKSPIHRATVNSEKNRISIASLHSLSFDRKVRPAHELVDEQHLLSTTLLYTIILPSIMAIFTSYSTSRGMDTWYSTETLLCSTDRRELIDKHSTL